MDMTLSKRGDYVVRSALCLARAYPEGSPRKIREVVAEMGVPSTFASQILADLVRSGLAVSKAGKDGGYKLSRSPEHISLLAVVEAGEGRLRSERCAMGEGPCRWDAVCPLHDTWTQATAAVRDVLGATTLAGLEASDRALENASSQAPADSHRRPQFVEISDSVHVEVSVAALRERLRSDTWLRQVVVDSHAEALGTSKAASPGASKKHTAVATGALVMLDDAGTRSGDRSTDDQRFDGSWGLIWDFSFLTGPSRFEGTVSACALDPERTELVLEGRMRPPLGVSVTAPDDAPRAAQAVCRTFLRHLAAALEGPATNVAGSAGRAPTRRATTALHASPSRPAEVTPKRPARKLPARPKKVGARAAGS